MKHLGLDVELFVLTLWKDSGESLLWSQPTVHKSFILPDAYARQDENNQKGRLNTSRNNILNLNKDQRD